MVEENSLLDNIRVCHLCKSATSNPNWLKYGNEKQYYICNKCYIKDYKVNNIEKFKNYQKIFYQRHRNEICKQNNDKLKSNHNLYRKRFRSGLLQVLGNKCCKCGFSDSRALQFDHVNDDGYLDKQKLKHANSIIAYYYKNPEIAKQKLQILCANCNWIKRYEVNKHNQYNR